MRRTRRWVLPAACAVVLGGTALYCHGVASAKWAVVRGWLDSRPGLTPVDLSRPGAVTVRLPQPVGTHHHGQSFYLDLGTAGPSGAGMLNGLSGTLRVTDDQGDVVERILLREGMESEADAPGRYRLGTPVTLPQGEYDLTVEVETGAPATAGCESVIYSRYAICELEALPAMVWRLLAWLAGIPAFIAGLIAAVRAVLPAAHHRHRSRTGINS